jgi:hypothetical protein
MIFSTEEVQQQMPRELCTVRQSVSAICCICTHWSMSFFMYHTALKLDPIYLFIYLFAVYLTMALVLSSNEVESCLCGLVGRGLQ